MNTVNTNSIVSEKKYLFLKSVQMPTKDIKWVSLLSGYDETFSKKRINPRLVIHDNGGIFYGSEALEAIDALLKCGFYNENEHKIVHCEMQRLITEESLINKGK